VSVLFQKAWTIIVVDVEASGNLRAYKGIVPYHNLLEIGAVEVILSNTQKRICSKFYAILKPVNDRYDPEAIKKTSGKSLEFYKKRGEDPAVAMKRFYEYLKSIKARTGRKVLLASDNPEFDVGWIRLYLELFGFNAYEILHHNPMSLKDLVRGIFRDLKMNLYRLPPVFSVKLPHTHNALDDARRNAHILLKLSHVLRL